MKKYIYAFLIATLLTTTLYATGITEKIDVAFNAISIMVNGEKVQADNIVHEGTTYVPLRAVSELLGKDVVWTSETKIAQINDPGAKQENPMTTITMKNGDQIIMELYPEVAPITVENFLSLINQGFYDGLDFHRAIPGFMVQGGDPKGDGTGGSGKPIKGEFSKNGVKNEILHTRGTVSMARLGGDSNSATSQFFIVVADSHYLNGEYAGFGRIIKGMEHVDKIVNGEIGPNDKPLNPQIIKSIKVD